MSCRGSVVMAGALLATGCAGSSFVGGDDALVAVGDGPGSATVMRVSVEVEANGERRLLDPFVVAVTDAQADTVHVTFNSEAINRGAFADDTPQFFEAAERGDDAFARNTPWPILPGGPEGVIWGVWYRVDDFNFDGFRATDPAAVAWLNGTGQSTEEFPTTFVIDGTTVLDLQANDAPLAGLGTLALPIEPELGVRVTIDADGDGRITTLVIEPVVQTEFDSVHRVDAAFDHDIRLADLGLDSAIDPPPDSLDG